jgi:hypothetical protein
MAEAYHFFLDERDASQMSWFEGEVCGKGGRGYIFHERYRKLVESRCQRVEKAWAGRGSSAEACPWVLVFFAGLIILWRTWTGDISEAVRLCGCEVG